MKVAIYWNLHRKCWSIQSREKNTYGRVIAHAKEVSVERASYKVNEGGRQRVLRERKKNVHAFVVGALRWFRDLEGYLHEIMLNAQNRITAKFQEVTYNPYKHECFVMKGMGEPIFDSLEAYLTPEKKVYAIYW